VIVVTLLQSWCILNVLIAYQTYVGHVQQGDAVSSVTSAHILGRSLCQ